jgi:fimbrial chaperone protein
MVLPWRGASAAGCIAAAAALAVQAGGQAARGQELTQGLTVIPVTFELTPGQMTAALSIQNHTDRETDFQVRPYAWDQAGGVDRLTPTDALIVSPPLGRIAAGGEQVVRLVLRRPAQGQEASYRILLDQVPPPPQPGVVNMVLKVSIPVFVEASARDAAHVQWSIQSDAGAYYLVAVNRGGRHEVFHDLALTSADGRPIVLESNVLAYVLPGASRRWHILTQSFAPSREALRLTARASSGPVEQTVPANSVSP